MPIPAPLPTSQPDPSIQIQQLEQEVAVIKDDLERERETVANLNRMIRMRCGAATTANTSADTGRKKIADPEKYEGDREALPEFLLQLRLKAPTLRDEQARLRYAISLLKGRALTQIRPYINAGRVDLDNLDALIAKLDAAFGDPDRRGTAERKLLNLRQTTRDFPTFFAEFSRYAADTNWDNNAKRSLMRNALYYELKADLMGQAEPADYDQWIALLQRLNTKRRQLNSENRRLITSTPQASARPTLAAYISTPSSSSTTPRTSTTAATVPSTTPSASTATGTAPGPMDLSSGRKRLSTEERRRRMEEGRCMYCGGLGHMARECPNARHPLRAAETTVTTENVEAATGNVTASTGNQRLPCRLVALPGSRTIFCLHLRPYLRCLVSPCVLLRKMN